MRRRLPLADDDPMRETLHRLLFAVGAALDGLDYSLCKSARSEPPTASLRSEGVEAGLGTGLAADRDRDPRLRS